MTLKLPLKFTKRMELPSMFVFLLTLDPKNNMKNGIMNDTKMVFMRLMLS